MFSIFLLVFHKGNLQDVSRKECTYKNVSYKADIECWLFSHHLDYKLQVSRYCSKRLHELLAEEWLRGSCENQWNDRWKEALTRAYNRADDAFIDKTLAPHTVGSTAVVVILSACQIIVANCGDSRAVLCRGNQVIPLTVDHKVCPQIFKLFLSTLLCQYFKAEIFLIKGYSFLVFIIYGNYLFFHRFDLSFFFLFRTNKSNGCFKW